MDIQALGMLSNITAIVQKQNVNTIENDINVEKGFLRKSKGTADKLCKRRYI